MCGLHWYRQELEKADGNNKKLDELKQMLEQRFNISESLLVENNEKNAEIILLYNEIMAQHQKRRLTTKYPTNGYYIQF